MEKLMQPVRKIRMSWIDIQPYNMDITSLINGRKLNSTDDFKRGACCGRHCFVQTGHAVVIRQGKSSQPPGNGIVYQLSWCKSAIGSSGMDMQINGCMCHKCLQIHRCQIKDADWIINEMEGKYK